MTEIEKKIYEENAERGYQNKIRGNRYELKIHNMEKRNSILSIHSDGSYGKIDIAAIRKGYVLLIVCKENGYLSPSERKDLDKLKAKLPKFCRIQIRYKVGRKTVKRWY